MSIRRRLFLILLLLPSGISAQQPFDYTLFKQSAGNASMLYRGVVPVRYVGKVPTNGTTYFAYSAQFESGTVKYCGKLYYNALLNLNANLDELYAKDSISDLCYLLNKNFVDYWEVGNRKFTNYTQSVLYQGLQSGYYEVVYDGRAKAYKKIRKIYEENISGTSVTKSYELSEDYYLLKEGKAYRIKNVAGIARQYKDRKKEIKSLIKSKRLNFKANTSYTIAEILQHLENSDNN